MRIWCGKRQRKTIPGRANHICKDFVAGGSTANLRSGRTQVARVLRERRTVVTEHQSYYKSSGEDLRNRERRG